MCHSAAVIKVINTQVNINIITFIVLQIQLLFVYLAVLAINAVVRSGFRFCRHPVIAPEAVIRADHALAGERLGEVAAHVFRYLARRSEVFPPPAPKSQNKPCEATRRANQFFCVIHDLFSALRLPPH